VIGITRCQTKNLTTNPKTPPRKVPQEGNPLKDRGDCQEKTLVDRKQMFARERGRGGLKNEKQGSRKGQHGQTGPERQMLACVHKKVPLDGPERKKRKKREILK